tara:strand:- start:193 stop:423 length:231 start_codon:yes stop_codon:yes gene_type:complete
VDKAMERKIIILLVLILIGLGLSGCVKPQVKHDHPKQPTTLETIAKLDAIGKVLGCMFDPAPCQEKKEEYKPEVSE